MQAQHSSSKGTWIALISIIFISLALFFYFKGDPAANGDPLSSLQELQTPQSADARAASDRIVMLLNQIKSLKIDRTLFDDPVYKSLSDYTVAVPEQNIGRPNPFIPIGGIIIPQTKK